MFWRKHLCSFSLPSGAKFRSNSPKPTQILFFLSPQPKEWFPNVIEDFQSCGDGHSRFFTPTGGSMHLRSEIMQKLKVSIGTRNVSTSPGA